MKTLANFEFKNIIVRMPNWIGDLVMATPILTDLRRKYPNAKITAMCRTPLSDLLKEDLEINEILCFNKTTNLSSHRNRKFVIEKLKQSNYDLGILLTHSFSSAWIFWRGKIKYRIGYGFNARNFLLTHSIPLPKNLEKQHLVITYKMLLHPLNIPISHCSPRIFLSQKEINDAYSLLKQHGISKKHTLIGINPGAAYGSAKCWLPERFEEATKQLLLDPNVFIIYFGDQSFAFLAKEICQKIISNRIVNLAGLTSLRELAALIKVCDVILTNDSGPMHIADALNRSVVALFGPTNEIVTGPYNNGVILHKHVECSPCYLRTCSKDFKCMKKITVNEVVNAITTILEKNKKSNINKINIHA